MPDRRGSDHEEENSERLGFLLIADLYAHLKALRLLQEERAAFLKGDPEAARTLGCSRERLSQRIAALEHTCLRSLGGSPSPQTPAQVAEALRQAHAQDGRTFEALWLGVCLLKERMRWIAAGNVALVSRAARGSQAGSLEDKKK